jgi:hypothetical protein
VDEGFNACVTDEVLKVVPDFIPFFNAFLSGPGLNDLFYRQNADDLAVLFKAGNFYVFPPAAFKENKIFEAAYGDVPVVEGGNYVFPRRFWFGKPGPEAPEGETYGE